MSEPISCECENKSCTAEPHRGRAKCSISTTDDSQFNTIVDTENGDKTIEVCHDCTIANTMAFDISGAEDESGAYDQK